MAATIELGWGPGYLLCLTLTTDALITWNCVPMLCVAKERGSNNLGAAERKDSSNQLKIVVFL